MVNMAVGVDALAVLGQMPITVDTAFPPDDGEDEKKAKASEDDGEDYLRDGHKSRFNSTCSGSGPLVYAKNGC